MYGGGASSFDTSCIVFPADMSERCPFWEGVTDLFACEKDWTIRHRPEFIGSIHQKSSGCKKLCSDTVERLRIRSVVSEEADYIGSRK